MGEIQKIASLSSIPSRVIDQLLEFVALFGSIWQINRTRLCLYSTPLTTPLRNNSQSDKQRVVEMHLSESTARRTPSSLLITRYGAMVVLNTPHMANTTRLTQYCHLSLNLICTIIKAEESKRSPPNRRRPPGCHG